jgi:tape measure domain-containing protein
MATETNTVKISIKTFGNDELKKLNATFGRINKTLVLNKKSLNDTVASILRVDKRAKSFNGGLARSNKIIRDQIAAFKVLRDQVDKGGASYSRFTAEINKLNASLSIQPSTQYASPIGPVMDTRGRFGKIRDRIVGSAQNMGVGQKAALGAIAGSGAAGSLGAVGSMGLAGAAVGGPVGAAIGAAAGLSVETIKAAKAAAQYSAQIQKLEIALKGVTKTQAEFEKAQKVISTTSRRLNVPLGAATKQFTTLSASVIGAGGNVDDAEKVFKGVSEAIKATGGDAEDVQSAIRAMSQIFGKGKVSAEELQGQLGERLPGAVVKFANATGRSLPELQKDLRDGTVGLNDVMKFVVKLSEDHAAAAEEMANSSVDAGQRMAVSLQALQKEFGDLFVPVGAMIQKFIAGMADALTAVIKFFRGTRKESNEAMAEAFALEQVGGRDAMSKTGKRRFAKTGVFDISMLKADKRDQFSFIQGERLDFLNQGANGATSKFEDPTSDDQKLLNLEKIKNELGLVGDKEIKNLEITIRAKEIYKEIGEEANTLGLTIESITEKLKNANPEAGKLSEKFQKLVDDTTDLKTKVGELALDVTNKLANAFADFFVEGKRGFADLARSAIKELQKIIVRAAFMKFIANPITNALGLTSSANGNVISGGEVVPSAMGNVFAKNKIVPYAMGGIVNKPTIFPMKNGMGLMGEAGAEAIMPLKRGRDGKLGVMSQGGGSTNIVVNVDASGSTVEGDEDGGKELGRLISVAIQSELINQKRPGGLLA